MTRTLTKLFSVQTGNASQGSTDVVGAAEWDKLQQKVKQFEDNDLVHRIIARLLGI